MAMFYCWAFICGDVSAGELVSHLHDSHGFRSDGISFYHESPVDSGCNGNLICSQTDWPGALALWICYLSVLFPFTGLFEYTHFTMTGIIILLASLQRS